MCNTNCVITNNVLIKVIGQYMCNIQYNLVINLMYIGNTKKNYKTIKLTKNIIKYKNNQKNIYISVSEVLLCGIVCNVIYYVICILYKVCLFNLVIMY